VSTNALRRQVSTKVSHFRYDKYHIFNDLRNFKVFNSIDKTFVVPTVSSSKFYSNAVIGAQSVHHDFPSASIFPVTPKRPIFGARLGPPTPQHAFFTHMTEVLLELPVFSKLSQRVWRVLGFNPGKFTLQGD
jgi:hypothetical protein